MVQARVWALLCLGLTAFAVGPLAQAEQAFNEWDPPRTDAALLPHFCWGPPSNKGHFDVKGPEFEIPTSKCGPAVNHYCGGLLFLLWANRSFGNKSEKRILLVKARDSTLYTLKGIEGYPECPIREHAEKTLQQVNTQLQILH